MSDSRPFYVTTPIYYINDAPHLGHAYTTVACDAMARHHRRLGRPVRFQTGTDEHGLKAARSAEKQGITPQELADRNAEAYQACWKILDIDADRFIRTTEADHHAGAQELWRRIAKNDDFYKASYSGPYCVGCETRFTEAQLVDGKCPESPDHSIEILEEENWYFKLGRYADALLKHYEENPDFIAPESKRNEIRSFVEGGLEDLPVSRSSFAWGVPVPDDDQHVMWVWIDALSNYLTGLGYHHDDQALVEQFWPESLHVVGKDISRFHAVFWPAFLMSAGLPLPKQVLAHGFLVKDGAKMSKTSGNIANPVQLADWFGADAVRYFCLREVRLGADGNYSDESVIDRINTDLVNDLGNTLSRVTRLVTSELDGVAPKPPAEEGPLAEVTRQAWAKHLAAMEANQPHDALAAANELISETNKFFVQHEPWKLARDESKKDELARVLHDGAEAVRHATLMFGPAIPGKAREVWSRLGLPDDPVDGSLSEHFEGSGEELGAPLWGFPEGGGPIEHGDPVFPRIDKKAFFKDLAKAEGKDGGKQQQKKKSKKEKPPEELPEGVITIDDFFKVQLRSAKVKTCRKHEKADKLLVLELDDGSGQERTICAGVAAFYAPDELTGKTICVVANLAPRKLRGIPSQGMLLAANYEVDGEERVRVITLPDEVPAGAELR
ncbi:MAG: methionine--tRNA ligase [Acidobacteriota bacterium]